ncbi:MAG: hypothetical protein JJT82_08875 [Legionellaceae bacterium]|nr:hypothetical protein [Legionellaceae bacterium]
MKKIFAIIAVMFGVSMFAYAKMNTGTVVVDNTMPNQTTPSEQATQPQTGYDTQAPAQQTTQPMPDQSTQPAPAYPDSSTETDEGTDMTTDPTDDDSMDGSGDEADDSEETYHSAQ